MATGESLPGPERVRKLQTVLHAKAKEEPERRFHALVDKVWREDFLAEAWRRVRRNGGSAGVDGETFTDIERYGVGRWLGELARDLKDGTYAPKPVRQVLIPKKQPGKFRPLGIPCVRDRVAQTSALLVVEPIFEADLQPEQYAYRPGRSAHDAVKRVHSLLNTGHNEVVQCDLSNYFGEIPHAELLKSFARRISDGRMLKLIKAWLEMPVEEDDGEGGKRRTNRARRERKGTPQVVPPFALFHDAGAEPLGDQPDDPAVPNPVLHEPKKPASINLVEVGPNVRIGYPVDLAPFYPECQGIERIVRTTPGSEPIAEPEELRLEYRHKDGLSHRRLDDLVLQCSDAQRSCSPVRLRYLHPPGRKRPVPSAMNPVMQVEQSLFQPVAVFMPRHPVHACRSVLLQREVGHAERVRRDVVQKSSELLLRFPRGCLPYPLRRL